MLKEPAIVPNSTPCTVRIESVKKDAVPAPSNGKLKSSMKVRK
jgi:hypothetical protein